MEQHTMKKMFIIASVNISIICVLLVGIELVGQMVYFLVKGQPLFEYATKHQQVFELHPYLAGRLKKSVRVVQDNKVITTTDIHTRVTGGVAHKNAIKIAVLGGSTTFGTGVTDADSWPALLQDILGNAYDVINYGVPGYSTAEAIIQMALIVPESRPHFVVMCEGWNDIRNYHDDDLGPDYFSHGMKQYGNLGISLQPREPLYVRLAQISATFHFALRISQKFSQQVRTQPSIDNQPSKAADPYVDRIYFRNLTTMKTLAHHMGAYALFVPQILNYADFKGKKSSRPWSPHIEDDAIPDLIDGFNGIMNTACQPDKANCAVLNEIIAEHWEPADFMDDGHLSQKGGSKFARIVAEHIREAVKQHSIGSDAQQSAPPDHHYASLPSGG
jgi:lysophospholipase L1-like esterase